MPHPSPARGAARSLSRPRVQSPPATPQLENGTQPAAQSSTSQPVNLEQLDLDDVPVQTTMLRGLLTLSLAKPTRIKRIGIKFRGLARTDWPEGELSQAYYLL